MNLFHRPFTLFTRDTENAEFYFFLQSGEKLIEENQRFLRNKLERISFIFLDIFCHIHQKHIVSMSRVYNPVVGIGLVIPLILIVSNERHDVLKESSSPDSFKENNLCVLCVSSAAGGKIDQIFSGRTSMI